MITLYINQANTNRFEKVKRKLAYTNITWARKQRKKHVYMIHSSTTDDKQRRKKKKIHSGNTDNKILPRDKS